MLLKPNGLRYFVGLAISAVIAGPWAPVAIAADTATAVERLEQVKVLDLKTAAHIALADNPTVAAARARVVQAGEVVKQARSSYWPRLDATAGASRVDLSERNFQSQAGPAQAFGVTFNNPEDYYRAGLRASWTVFDGFARKFSLAVAKYGEQATTEALSDTRRLLLSAVAFAFLEAQLAQENIAIAKADEAFNQRLLVEARLRYDVGTGALSDVLNFQVRVNDAQTQRILDENGFKAALITLAALLGVAEGQLPAHVELAVLTPPTETELSMPQADASLESAFALRPDLLQSEYFVQQAEAGIKVAKSGYYPSLLLSGAVEGERPEDLDFDGDDFGNSVALGLSWNLFAGGFTRAKTGEAKARLYEVEKIQEDAKVRVASQVQEVVTRILTAQQQLTLQETNTKLVQQQRDLVEKEYKAGVGSLVRLNEAQRDLTVARARLAFVRVALREAWYDLETATGQIVQTFSP